VIICNSIGQENAEVTAFQPLSTKKN